MYKILNIETGAYLYQATYWRKDNRWAIKETKSVVQTDYFFPDDPKKEEWKREEVFKTAKLHYAKLILRNYVNALCNRQKKQYMKRYLDYYEIVRC